MNNLYSSASTDLQDETLTENESLGPGISGNSFLEERPIPGLLCLSRGCEHLRFSSEAQHHTHLLTHITLPTVNVKRLNLDSTSIKNCEQKLEPLKVRLKLTSQVGSEKPEFEEFLTSSWIKKLKDSADVRSDFSNQLFQCDYPNDEVVTSKKLSLGSGEAFDAFDRLLQSEFLGNNLTSEPQRPSGREPVTHSALDEPTLNSPTEEREDRDHQAEQEEDSNQDEDNPGDTSQDEEEEDSEGEAESPPAAPSPAPTSPSPSEVLRPQGFLAPESVVDDDSCYPNSPASPTGARMVEMNSSTSVIGGSDNDSGHSRSPSTFTGAGGEGDSSAQQEFNWEQEFGESTGHDSNEAGSNGNGDSHSSPGGHDDVASVLDSAVASNLLESDPLLLPDNSVSADGEQDNLNLLQNLTADVPDVDRGAGGETEYMSLDRLGESSYCCDVCGERTQDRRSLEDHRAMAGHFKCLVMPECGSTIWRTAAELAAHQSSIHNISQSQVSQSQQSPQQRSTPPQTSPQGAPGTPPVQQLAQQVQRLPIPPPAGYPISMPGGQYPPQQMPPQMPPQMQMGPGPLPGQMPPSRRPPPMGYRMPMPGPAPGQQPYGPVGPVGPVPGQAQAGFSGGIQPRPLNALVAQAPARGRLPPGAGMPQRGMAPMAMRGQKRPGPVPGAGRGMVPPSAKQRRVAAAEAMLPPQQETPGKKSDAKAVANILATRGITVTPASGGGRGGGVASAAAAQVARQRQNMQAPAPPPPVTTLNLNSAISIIPTTGSGNNRQSNAGFAVPQGRAGRQPLTTNVDRPPRPPTVDLTGDGPVPAAGSTRLQMGGPSFHRGRGRPATYTRTTCQVCDKVFPTPELLNTHMAVHRGPGKLPFRCNLCNAQYPTNAGLQQHRQTYHKEAMTGMSGPLAPGEEMVIPLIDLKQPGVASRLSSLGIHHCIPLSGLGNQANGYFSLPVVSIDGSRPAAAGNLRSLGASGVLSIGPIKLVPK